MSPAREKSLGEAVHGLCRAQGLSLQELAVLVGVSRQALYDWFNGTAVKPHYMKQLVEHLRPNDTERGELLRAAGYPLEYGGSMTLMNSTVSGNTVNFGGGGIYNDGDMNLTNSTVSDNTAYSDGGGIYNDNGGSLTLMNSTISGNNAFGGGGIYNGGSMILTNSTVSDNVASSGNAGDGGGIYNAASLTRTNGLVSRNTTSPSGGNMENNDGGSLGGNLILANSTISDNTASQGIGGGISNYGGKVTLMFCTLYGNNADIGGGLFTEDNAAYPSQTLPGVSIMSNSLVAGNRAASTNPDIAGNLTTEGYNLLQRTTGITFLDPSHKHSTDLINMQLSDIKVDPNLRLNGSKTMKTNALLVGSPAIDKVPLSDCLIKVGDITITTDQRGVKRPQGAACDIGAYEYVP